MIHLIIRCKNKCYLKIYYVKKDNFDGQFSTRSTVVVFILKKKIDL